MKKKVSHILGVLCYALGIFFALYVGGWLMLIKPIHMLMDAFSNDSLTLTLLLKSIIKIAFSTTFAISDTIILRGQKTLTGRQ